MEVMMICDCSKASAVHKYLTGVCMHWGYSNTAVGGFLVQQPVIGM